MKVGPDRYVVGTGDKTLFIRCWTEGETIILTRDAENAETHRTAEEAKEYVTRVRDNAEVFIIENPDSNLVEEQTEIPMPELKAWKAVLVVTIVPVD